MCLFESLEGKDVSEQLSKEFQSQEQILYRDSCCHNLLLLSIYLSILIALTSRIIMAGRCALKDVKQSTNQMGENSAFHI